MLFVNETNALIFFGVVSREKHYPQQKKFQLCKPPTFSSCATTCQNDDLCVGFLHGSKSAHCKRYYDQPVFGFAEESPGAVLYEKLIPTSAPTSASTSPHLILSSTSLSLSNSTSITQFQISSLFTSLYFIFGVIALFLFFLPICMFCFCQWYRRSRDISTGIEKREKLDLTYQNTIRASFQEFYGNRPDSASEIGYDLETFWKHMEPGESALDPGHLPTVGRHYYSDIDIEKGSFPGRYSTARLLSTTASSESSRSLSTTKISKHKDKNEGSTVLPKESSIYCPSARYGNSPSKSTPPKSTPPVKPSIRDSKQPSVSSSTSVKTSFFRIPFEDIQLIKVIGSGHFGDVWHAKWNGAHIAMKQVSRSGHQKELLEESKMLLQMNHHPHVCQIYGLTSKGDEIFMVQNFYHNGSVADYFKNHDVSETLKFRFIAHACMGIEFLHQNKVVHRDIAARNLLVDGSLGVCVSDFGLARKLSRMEMRKKTTTSFGPVRWMAVESIDRGEYSTMSDMWMLGVTVWEILSDCEEPWQGLANQNVMAKVLEGETLMCPENWDSKISTLLSKCWLMKPSSRPNARTLRVFFELLHDSYFV